MPTLPEPERALAEGYTRSPPTRVIALLVKYVDDCRWAAISAQIAQQTEDYLQKTYGIFRDLHHEVGVMLGKNYHRHPKLDGVGTTRLVMEMQKTEEKYLLDGIAFFVESYGHEWRGAR